MRSLFDEWSDSRDQFSFFRRFYPWDIPRMVVWVSGRFSSNWWKYPGIFDRRHFALNRWFFVSWRIHGYPVRLDCFAKVFPDAPAPGEVPICFCECVPMRDLNWHSTFWRWISHRTAWTVRALALRQATSCISKIIIQPPNTTANIF